MIRASATDVWLFGIACEGFEFWSIGIGAEDSHGQGRPRFAADSARGQQARRPFIPLIVDDGKQRDIKSLVPTSPQADANGNIELQIDPLRQVQTHK